MSAIEFMSDLVLKFKKLNEDLKKENIKINMSLLSGTFQYGYIGTSQRINQVLINKEINIIDKYLSKEYLSEVSLLISQEAYKNLHPDLQILCFPYEILEDIYYKVYCPEVYDPDIVFENSLHVEEEIYSSEFNLERIGKFREKIKNTIRIDFELLLDNIYSTNHITQNANPSLKTLTKLAFHYLLTKDYKNVHEILDDICSVITSEKGVDRDYLFKIKQYKEKAQQKMMTQSIKP